MLEDVAADECSVCIQSPVVTCSTRKIFGGITGESNVRYNGGKGGEGSFIDSGEVLVVQSPFHPGPWLTDPSHCDCASSSSHCDCSPHRDRSSPSGLCAVLLVGLLDLIAQPHLQTRISAKYLSRFS